MDFIGKVNKEGVVAELDFKELITILKTLCTRGLAVRTPYQDQTCRGIGKKWQL